MKNVKKKTTPKMRNEFIARTYAIVLKCIGEQTDAVPSKVEIRLTLTNNNRYVRLHKYGEDMALLIYRDGKVALELSEACHDKHKEQLFDYATDADHADIFFAELEDMLPCVMKVYLEKDVMDFHSFMDYVRDDVPAFDSYKQMMHEYRQDHAEE